MSATQSPRPETSPLALCVHTCAQECARASAHACEEHPTSTRNSRDGTNTQQSGRQRVEALSPRLRVHSCKRRMGRPKPQAQEQQLETEILSTSYTSSYMYLTLRKNPNPLICQKNHNTQNTQNNPKPRRKSPGTRCLQRVEVEAAKALSRVRIHPPGHN